MTNPPVSITIVDSILADHRKMEELYDRFCKLARFDPTANNGRPHERYD